MTVLDDLGYSASQHFLPAAKANHLPPSELTYGLRAALETCAQLCGVGTDLGFKGVYVLQEEPKSLAIPIVYVVRVDSNSAAQKVHRFVWNQNLVPFLIVESPATIRLYPGFAYDRQNDDSLVEVAANTASILERLAAFHADAINEGVVWSQWAHAVDPESRVDEALLRDLRLLDEKLQNEEGLSRAASHGLIGKYVYLRYLRDRDILSTKKLDKWALTHNQVFSRQATKSAFARLDQELQSWLNGSVFSFGEDALKEISQAQLRLVAGVFSGDSPDGQLNLFDPYDFSHIPIETLSCVYEQFLHDAKTADGSSRGKTLGAYYTPIPLTDYVISEMDRKQPLKLGMKVLDPACGSGAFLVQCYRRLIERRRRVERRDLKASELRELLTTHLYGIDRDDDACRVAELSLILTLLDYVDPPDLENTTFKLPYLRGNNIFQGDFFAYDGPVQEFLGREQFDWIVGNPPWAEVKGTPAEDHEHHPAHTWMAEHAGEAPTSGNQIAEAFLWKAGLHLAEAGAASLVVPAMTWFKKEGTSFRKSFFSQRSVWCLSNFANLAYVLFAGRSERPASVVFFQDKPPDEEHRILTFAPFVAEQVANRPDKPNRRQTTWNIVVSASDLKEIENLAAIEGGSLTWKIAMWGTSRDRKLLQRVAKRFGTLQALAPHGISEPHQGLELRPSTASEDLEHHPELEGKKKLLFDKLRNTHRLFSFPRISLGTIDASECFIRKGRSKLPIAVSTPPHVIVDASRRFAVFSNEFIAVPSRQIGIAGTHQSKDHLRALSLFLSSDWCRYNQFFLSPKWGIDESIADLATLKQLPIPITELSANQLKEWVELHRDLALLSAEQREHPKFGVPYHLQIEVLVAVVNDRVFDLLDLRKTERWLVEDFVQRHLELNKGKVTDDAIRPPNPPEVLTYLTALRDCLDGFLTGKIVCRHRIEALVGQDSALLAISATKQNAPVAPSVVDAEEPNASGLNAIRDMLRSQQSQWIYFDRALKVYERGVLYQFKPMQLLHWTRRQAVIDADEIIAETLAEGGAE
jgi:type I restriction-modification system DNA methylase subunit